MNGRVKRPRFDVDSFYFDFFRYVVFTLLRSSFILGRNRPNESAEFSHSVYVALFFLCVSVATYVIFCFTTGFAELKTRKVLQYLITTAERRDYG
jgi:ABC-type Na+ efflux pump permease subunit